MLRRKLSESERSNGAYFSDFDQTLFSWLPRDHNSRLCPNGKEVGVFLYREDAHRWDGARSSFLWRALFFAKDTFLVSVHVLDRVLFFVVAVEPDFVVRVVVSQDLQE